jgi:hypothetical protein
MRKLVYIIFVVSIALATCQTPDRNIVSVHIDTSKETGTIRPVNGGNLGPLCHLKMLDLREEFAELDIPIIRTHDVPWFSMPAVDIHTIFKDFRLDPSDENNYEFRQTDDYIASLIETGADIVYRLGESIEHSEKKYYVNPPEDNEKWAEICCGIIRHYNEGWANGFHYGIKYWEIWNEPDIRPACWTGTDEQFFDLFNTAATKIKEEFPDVMIGGPAVAHPVDVKDGIAAPTDFTKKFLQNCSALTVPLDFFSWHMYSDDPWLTGQRPSYVREVLDQFGFNETESHLNEWNYIPGNNWNALMVEQGSTRKQIYATQSGIKGAAFIANVLMLLQDEPVDVVNFYTTTAGLFGIFSGYGEPLKAYYAHKAYAELLKTPRRVSVDYEMEEGLVLCAGINKEHTAISILASNFHEENKTLSLNFNPFDLKGTFTYELYVIDDKNDLALIKEITLGSEDLLQINEYIPGPSIFLIRIFESG